MQGMPRSHLSAVLFLAPFCSAQAREPVTYTEHIAPLMYQNCTVCHREGMIAPFALTNYQETRRRARMIQRVTSRRLMPPWHPVPGHGEFVGGRRLSDAELELIDRWVRGGMPEGDPEKMPAMPAFPDGWVLGEPDIVLEMEEAFPVPAGGRDIYRNFVLKSEHEEDLWIAAIEIRPSAPTVLHHSLFWADPQRAGRRQDGRDGKPGFRGMRQRGMSLGGWAVGGQPNRLPDEMAMRLPAGADILLSSHFHPSGKPEQEKTRIGLFLAKKRPSRSLARFQVPPLYGALHNLVIPAGAKEHVLEERFKLPCDTDLITIGGHAHYLCKSMQATAHYPDGTKESIFYIDNWAFNWQGRYRYKELKRLPAGTVIHSKLVYDNSADNPQNPHDPPRRVRWGLESTDEMGSILFLASPAKEADLGKLQRNIRLAQADAAISRMSRGSRRGLQRLAGELPKFDKDGDGKVRVEDIPRGWRRRLARQIDADKDGVITAEERKRAAR